MGDAFEGVLIRKHTYESLDRKASSRLVASKNHFAVKLFEIS